MNKEFEEWKKTPIGQRLFFYPNNGLLYKNDVQEIFTAGQQSVSPRWILVTERLPTEKDGEVQLFNNNVKYIRIIGVNKETGKAQEGMYFINGNQKIENLWFSKWQPLPEV